MPPKTTTANAAAEERELLESLKARKLSNETVTPVVVTAEERSVARLMRERDHKDGCPAYANPGHIGHARVEAFVQPIVAPAPALEAQGVRKGDQIVVVHCLTCGELRYFAKYATVEDLLIAALTGGVAVDDAAPPAGPDETL